MIKIEPLHPMDPNVQFEIFQRTDSGKWRSLAVCNNVPNSRLVMNALQRVFPETSFQRVPLIFVSLSQK